jgi:hypothetical protein
MIIGIIIDINETLGEALFIPHPILLIHRMLPFSTGLEGFSVKDVFPPSIHRASPSIPRIVIIAALRNLILVVI